MNRKEFNRQETKNHIRKVFLRMYADSDIHDITIQDLCREAGIVKSTFYSYYDDKYSVLDEIETEMLQRLAEINARLEDVDVEQVLRGNPLDQASRTVDYLLKHLEEFRIVMGSHGDPRFENKWRRDIADSFADRFLKEKRDPQSAGLACAIFSSTLIGIYRYFIFRNPTISKEDFALILGNTFKYALQDFLPGKR
ncbi:MAG: TetR/AcrR family transcriptional regulator [Eubacterium sp.]|nr:TetR/AcrR family transcriptional regulator [Eubacterium sp.]